MRYKYYISFTGIRGTYYQIYPSNQISITGEMVENSFILQHKCGAVKIGGFKNASVYNTLNTWWDDDTKFSSFIYLKITKDGSLKYYYRFGIKYGKINKTTLTYEVTPLIYDNYSLYIEPYLDYSKYVSISNNINFYNKAIIHYPVYSALESIFTPVEWIKNFLKNRISALTGFSSSNIVSTLLFGDDYPDTTPAPTLNGMLKDYVTDTYSNFYGACIFLDDERKRTITLKDILTFLRYFQIYYYFDSNGKLRFEHISYFEAEIFANENSISSLINDDAIYNYITPEIPTLETIEIETNEDADEDFIKSNIVYNNARNIINSYSKSFNFSIIENIESFVATMPGSYFVFIAGINNQTFYFVNTNMGSFSATHHVLTLTASAINQKCRSTDFYKALNADVYYEIVTDSITGEFDVYLSNPTTPISNPISITTTGTKSGEFVITDGSLLSNCHLEIKATVTGTWSCYIIVTTGKFRNTWASGILSSTDKPNGDFSLANVLDSYWRHGRLSLAGTMNDASETFDSTDFNLQREEIKIYYPDDIGALECFNDGNYKGIVEKYTRNLDTDVVKISLKYQEIS